MASIRPGMEGTGASVPQSEDHQLTSVSLETKVAEVFSEGVPSNIQAPTLPSLPPSTPIEESSEKTQQVAQKTETVANETLNLSASALEEQINHASSPQEVKQLVQQAITERAKSGQFAALNDVFQHASVLSHEEVTEVFQHVLETLDPKAQEGLKLAYFEHAITSSLDHQSHLKQLAEQHKADPTFQQAFQKVAVTLDAKTANFLKAEVPSLRTLWPQEPAFTGTFHTTTANAIAFLKANGEQMALKPGTVAICSDPQMPNKLEFAVLNHQQQFQVFTAHVTDNGAYLVGNTLFSSKEKVLEHISNQVHIPCASLSTVSSFKVPDSIRQAKSAEDMQNAMASSFSPYGSEALLCLQALLQEGNSSSANLLTAFLCSPEAKEQGFSPDFKAILSSASLFNAPSVTQIVVKAAIDEGPGMLNMLAKLVANDKQSMALLLDQAPSETIPSLIENGIKSLTPENGKESLKFLLDYAKSTTPALYEKLMQTHGLQIQSIFFSAGDKAEVSVTVQMKLLQKAMDQDPTGKKLDALLSNHPNWFPEKMILPEHLSNSVSPENIATFLKHGFRPDPAVIDELSWRSGKEIEPSLKMLVANMQQLPEKHALALTENMSLAKLILERFPEFQTNKKFLQKVLQEANRPSKKPIDLGLLCTAVKHLQAMGAPFDLSGLLSRAADVSIVPPESMQDVMLVMMVLQAPTTMSLRIFSSLLTKLDTEANHPLLEQFLQNAPAEFAKEFWLHRASLPSAGSDTLFTNTLARLSLEQKSEVAVFSLSNGNDRLAKLLLENGAKLPRELLGMALLSWEGTKNVRLLDIYIEQAGGATPLLHEALAAGSSDVVSYLVSKGADSLTKNSQGLTAVESASLRGQLSLLKALIGDQAIRDHARHLLSSSADLEQAVIKAYLNSDYKEVALLIKELKGALQPEQRDAGLKALQKAQSFIDGPGKLIARFASSWHQNNMYSMYGKDRGFANYEEQQQKFAEGEYAKYQQVMKGVTTEGWSLLTTYKNLMKARGSEANFANWRLSVGADRPYTTEIGTHYARFRHIGNAMLQEAKEGSARVKLANDPENSYEVRHTLKNGKEITIVTVQLSRLDCAGEKLRPQWIHCDGSLIPEILPELSDVFDELKNPKPTMSLEERKEKLCYFYWLGAQVVPTVRGNSQYMLEMHQMLGEINGIDIGPPAREWVLADCVALSMPYSEFRDHYYSKLFEKAA